MESKVFDVEAAGLTLQFEFYTFDSIQEDLKKIFGDQVKQYNMSIYKKWSQIRQDQDKDRETKFFTYIKFFIEKRQIKHMVLLAEKLIIIIQIFHYTMRKKMNVDLDAYS